MANRTQMKSQRSLKIPAIFPSEKDAVFALSVTKTIAKAASVHVTPSTNGPLAPRAGAIADDDGDDG